MTYNNDQTPATFTPPTENQNERNWAALLNDRGLLKVRCPECYKLYNVRSADIRESRPKFKCTSCAQRFWLAYPEALEQPDGVIGFPIEWIENASTQPESATKLEAKPFACPKCSEAYGAGQSECLKCGLIFAKFQEREKLNHIRQASRSEEAHPAIAQDPEIKDEWEHVIQHFDNPAAHQKFIHLCQKLGAMDYAVTKYSELTEVCPHDENIKKCLTQCLAIQSVRTEIVREPAIAKTQANSLQNSWRSFVALVQSVPVETSILKKILKIRASTFMLLIAVGIVALGFSMPHMRNLVGVGCSLGFLAISLKYFRSA